MYKLSEEWRDIKGISDDDSVNIVKIPSSNECG
jgi:hypothetical protein